MIQHCSTPGRDGSKSAGCLGGRHFSNSQEALSHPLCPERAVRIEQYVLGEGVFEQLEDLFAKLSPKLHFEPLMLFVLDESESRHTKQM